MARSGRSGAGPRTPATVLDTWRGRARLALIRDLALGEWSPQEIARNLDIPASEVALFAAMHADEVTEVRAALAGKLAIETAGLWVSKRHNRVAEYQHQLEQLEKDIDDVRTVYGRGSKEHNNLLRTWTIMMGKVADEYLPTRTDRSDQEAGKVIRHVIEADDFIMAGLS